MLEERRINSGPPEHWKTLFDPGYHRMTMPRRRWSTVTLFTPTGEASASARLWLSSSPLTSWCWGIATSHSAITSRPSMWRWRSLSGAKNCCGAAPTERMWLRWTVCMPTLQPLGQLWTTMAMNLWSFPAELWSQRLNRPAPRNLWKTILTNLSFFLEVTDRGVCVLWCSS